jgi:Tol biopolymer transport system component
MIRLVLGLAWAAIAVLLAGAPVGASTGTTTRVSVGSDGSQASDGGIEASISGDGRFVAFRAGSSSIAVDPPTSCLGVYCTDIFLRDTVANSTEVVSVSTAGDRSNGFSDFPDISEDGRFVAFGSNAADLVSNDTNVCASVPSCSDVFVRDLLLGITERVSLTEADGEANADSYDPRISSDGRFVVFMSVADNLVPGDTNGKPDVFVRDRMNGTTERISMSSTGEQSNNYSYWPVISGDGRFVAFSSIATNLVADDIQTCPTFGNCMDVFVRDRDLDETYMGSVSDSGEHGNGDSRGASISSDGRLVGFYSDATNLVPGDTNGAYDVFLRDVLTGSTELISVSNEGIQGGSRSCSAIGTGAWPCIDMSADGRFVAFESTSRNFGSEQTCTPVYDTLHCSQIYVRDRQQETTVRVSVSGQGDDGGGDSTWPSLSSDGRFVAFQSSASNLVPNDDNQAQDIFLRDAGDTDDDGFWDAADNCPLITNAGGQGADSDGDLAGDACDAPGSGNVDCDGAVNPIDSLKVLRFAAGLPATQSEPCTNIGQTIGGGQVQGDVDCSDPHLVNPVDALKILRAVANLPLAKPPTCPEIKPP